MFICMHIFYPIICKKNLIPSVFVGQRIFRCSDFLILGSAHVEFSNFLIMLWTFSDSLKSQKMWSTYLGVRKCGQRTCRVFEICDVAQRIYRVLKFPYHVVYIDPAS